MKLDKNEYFDNNKIRITDKGWIDLQKFCTVVIRKRIGNVPWQADLISTALIECVEALDKYDNKKNNQLGGYLYLICLGCISKQANKAKKELVWDFHREINDIERYKRV